MYNGLGIQAPMGLIVAPSYSEYVSPQIGKYHFADAWRSRVIKPQFPVSSTGLGLWTGGNYLPPEDVETHQITSKSGFPTETGAALQQMYEGIREIIDEEGLPMPEWMEQFYNQLPTFSPEESEMPEVVVVEQEEPSFLEKHGKLVLFGGLAAGLVWMGMKRK